MIRGLVGIVPSHAVEVGRFYMAPHQEDKPWVFQCVQTSETLDGEFIRKALFFTTGGVADLGLHEIPTTSPLVALDDIHVRVDPTSLNNSAFTTNLQAGLFMIDCSDPILCVPQRSPPGWTAVNIERGRTIDKSLGRDWLSFSRWSLVMDGEDGEELMIAAFGDQDALTR